MLDHLNAASINHQTPPGGFLPPAAGLVAVVTSQSTLDVHLVAQRGYFGVSPPKVASEACEHAEAFCKLAVEGCGFICKIAAGSCVGIVVSWTIGTNPDAELVNTMVDAAIETVTNTSNRPVVHSDRGGHYRWPGWLSRMSEANLTRSMSRKACSPANAACKGFFGRLKKELFYPRDWLATTIEEFIEAVDSYIRWYNEKRIKIALGSLSPIEYRVSL